MKEVLLYTDGACSGNPGIGGWGAILIYGNYKREAGGSDPQTTNNRMELKGVIEGLKLLKERCRVQVYSDSNYVVQAFTENWLVGWEKRNWNKVKNPDLWKQLIELTGYHEVYFNKVKGHSDNELNNRCDEIARAEICKLRAALAIVPQ